MEEFIMVFRVKVQGKSWEAVEELASKLVKEDALPSLAEALALFDSSTQLRRGAWTVQIEK